MSFVHFDEMYEIIIGLMEEDAVVNNEMPPERFDEHNEVPVPIEHHWWEEAVTEIKMEKVKEELYV